MALYLIGDVQGCKGALQRLLDKCGFSPSRDTLWLLGDVVNRGPDSLGVLRLMTSLAGSAQCLLGNHDLHLLAMAHGAHRPHRGDSLSDVMTAPDRNDLLHWLKHQHMAATVRLGDKPLLMVHAGVLPSWTLRQTMQLAAEVETVLRGPDVAEFFAHMYGNKPAQWDDTLTGMERLRVIVNALTRLRFCTVQGEMEFASKDGARTAPPGYMPWFEVPARKTARVDVAFGHWSTLGKMTRKHLYALDSGCVWGGSLSALRVHSGNPVPELIRVSCEKSCVPGV